jgi:hypothetical protein
MYETRYRPKGDMTCDTCDNFLPNKERVLCDDCLKRAGTSDARLIYGNGDVIFHGSLGIRSFEAGWTA